MGIDFTLRDLILLANGIFIPLFGLFLASIRQLRKQTEGVRAELRAMNSRVLKQEVWRHEHDQADLQRHSDSLARVAAFQHELADIRKETNEILRSLLRQAKVG